MRSIPGSNFPPLSGRRGCGVGRLLVAAMAILLGGCGSPTRVPPGDLDALAHLAYPGDAEVGDDLTIIVTRHRTLLTLRNASAHPLRHAHLWLNRGYVTPLPALDVGEVLAVPLNGFRNRHGESYPRGTLLTPERDEPIVLAEIHDPTTALRHRLIVRMGRE